jgi:hypothetical protein
VIGYRYGFHIPAPRGVEKLAYAHRAVKQAVFRMQMQMHELIFHSYVRLFVFLCAETFFCFFEIMRRKTFVNKRFSPHPFSKNFII